MRSVLRATLAICVLLPSPWIVKTRPSTVIATIRAVPSVAVPADASAVTGAPSSTSTRAPSRRIALTCPSEVAATTSSRPSPSTSAVKSSRISPRIAALKALAADTNEKWTGVSSVARTATPSFSQLR